MAFVRGEEGSVSFEKDGGTLATVAGTRSWTLNVTKESLDVTAHDDSSRKFVGGLISGSGTVELIYNDAASGGAADLIDEVFVASNNAGADAKFELFTKGKTSDSSTTKISFDGLVTSMDVSATTGDLQVITCNFVTSGDITSAI